MKNIGLVVIITGLMAQVSWYGYFESEADYYRIPDNNIFLAYNKLRLDLDTRPSDQVRIGANLIHENFEGMVAFNFMEFLDQSLWPLLPLQNPDGTPLLDSENLPKLDRLDSFSIAYSDTTFVDNLFLEFHHSGFDIIVGKQQISPGVGYAWNPNDIFNLKDILDPTYEQTGIRAIQLEIPWQTHWALTGIWQPGDSWQKTTQYYQLKTGLGNFDLSLVYGKHNITETNLSALIVDSLGLWGAANKVYPLISEDTMTRELFGFNAEGELAGVGLRTEFATNRLDFKSEKLYYEYILGADYTFENSLYLLGELYHNDFGAIADETDFNDYLTYFIGERNSVNRNYLFGMAMYPLTDLIAAGCFTIFNTDDGSAVINPQLTYNIYQDVELSLFASLFTGADSDEFGYQQAALRIRLRVYF